MVGLAQGRPAGVVGLALSRLAGVVDLVIGRLVGVVCLVIGRLVGVLGLVLGRLEFNTPTRQKTYVGLVPPHPCAAACRPCVTGV